MYNIYMFFLLLINFWSDILFRQLHSFDKQSQAIRSLAWAWETQNQVFSLGKRAKQSGGKRLESQDNSSLKSFGKSGWDIYCVPTQQITNKNKFLVFQL